MDSIVWRQLWEETRDPALKERLIQYNKEDCIALKSLCDFIRDISDKGKHEQTSEKLTTDIVHTDELREKQSKRPQFTAKRFALKDLEYINKSAYFDYQRNKVYLRTDKNIRKIVRKENKKIEKQSQYKPTICVEITANKCPECGSELIERKNPLHRNVVDLKFTANGVRKYQPLYSSWRYRCLKCENLFAPKKWCENRYMYGSAS